MSNKNVENHMELLLSGNGGESEGTKSQGDIYHYVYITDFVKFIYNKLNLKLKPIFIGKFYNALAGRRI